MTVTLSALRARRTPLAALTALAALSLIGLTPQPARADPLTASLVYQVEDSSISARGLVPIDRKVTGTFEFYRSKSELGWSRIAPVHEFTEDRNENPEPKPLSPAVRVDVRIARERQL